MKILTCYSARFYGARGGRKKKNKAENEEKEIDNKKKGGHLTSALIVVIYKSTAGHTAPAKHPSRRSGRIEK